MAFINDSGVSGQLLLGITQNITGSFFLTYLFIVILFIAIALMLKLPMEITLPVLLPLLIILGLATSTMLPALEVAILYLAFMIYKIWAWNR